MSTEPEAVAPPVVAVVVTADSGPWLEDALAALAAQDYPNLSVLVLAAASGEDLTPRVAAVLPTAYVRRLPENRGYAASANEVLQVVEGASHLLFCHDDVAPEPDVVRLLVEEAFRSKRGWWRPSSSTGTTPTACSRSGWAPTRAGRPPPSSSGASSTRSSTTPCATCSWPRAAARSCGPTSSPPSAASTSAWSSTARTSTCRGGRRWPAPAWSSLLRHGCGTSRRCPAGGATTATWRRCAIRCGRCSCATGCGRS